MYMGVYESGPLTAGLIVIPPSIKVRLSGKGLVIVRDAHCVEVAGVMIRLTFYHQLVWGFMAFHDSKMSASVWRERLPRNMRYPKRKATNE